MNSATRRLALLALGLIQAALFGAEPALAVTFARQADRVRIEIGDRHFSDYVHAGWPKPSLYPILDADGKGPTVPGEPLTFKIRPGETIQARVKADRLDFADRIELGGDDSGRNLPFGCYVDNIGLNGLLIVEGQSEREFVITASPVAKPGRRLFHLRATADGGQCSAPVILEVMPAE